MSGCPFGQPLKFCIYENFYSSASLLAENINLTATMPAKNNSTPDKTPVLRSNLNRQNLIPQFSNPL